MALSRLTGGPCDPLKQTHDQKEAELLQAEQDRQVARQALTDAETAYQAALDSRDAAAQGAADAYQAWLDCITHQT